jgi:dimethylamine monooxygenase subunit C
MAVGVSEQHTSVPRWGDQPPAVDPAGREYVVVSSGEDARAVAAGWRDAVEALGRPLWSEHHDAGSAAPALAERLQGARVGVRVMIAAPELEALDALRAAHAAGAIDAEIRVHVTDRGVRRVQCPHCHAHTEAAVEVDATVTCDGCGRTLLVYHHVSRVHGAYLGFMADAEEPGG